MSDWSSFEKDKIATDAWRSYLNEGFAASAMQALTAPVGPRRIGIRGPLKRGIGPVRADAKEEEEETSPDEEGEETPFPPVTDAWSDSPKEGPIEVPDGEAGSDLPDAPEDPYGPDGREDDEDAEEEAEDSTESSFADKVQVILDALGVANLIPGGQIIGTPATVASLLLNLGRKKYNMALLDVLGLVPIAGGAAKAGKLGKTAASAAKMKKVAMAIDKAEKLNEPILIQRAFNSLLHEFKDTKIFDIVDGVLKTVGEHSGTDIGPFKERWEERKKDYINYKKSKRRAEKRTASGRKTGRRNEQRIVSESLEQRWQTIAGIKKSVI